MTAFSTPILLLVFKRPETTRLVFQTIRYVRPTALYIAADGARPDVPGEAEQCEEVRRIATSVDWNCEVRTLLRERNLGCGLAVSSGISWFFENVSEGIILEDDCVPGRSFYGFCEELLGRYRNDSRIMHVAGNSYQYGRRIGAGSYYFSKYANVWGWATWRRAWKHYDFSLRPSWRLEDTWDTQWQLSIGRSNGLAIVPNANLVKNIGFGPEGTHTRSLERPAFLGAQEIEFPLKHPRQMAPNAAADRFTYYAHYRNVRHLNLIWLYVFQDFVVSRLKALKNALWGRRRIGG